MFRKCYAKVVQKHRNSTTELTAFIGQKADILENQNDSKVVAK